jgi:hypothetical protein
MTQSVRALEAILTLLSVRHDGLHIAETTLIDLPDPRAAAMVCQFLGPRRLTSRACLWKERVCPKGVSGYEYP